MSLGGNQKPQQSWWTANSSRQSWFNTVKEKLAERSRNTGVFRTGAKIGIRRTKN